MITKEDAYKIANEYIKEKNRKIIDICPIEDVYLDANVKIEFGLKEGEVDDIWIVYYYMAWGLEERSVYIHISASTGEVYGSMGPHRWIEETENAS